MDSYWYRRFEEEEKTSPKHSKHWICNFLYVIFVVFFWRTNEGIRKKIYRKHTAFSCCYYAMCMAWFDTQYNAIWRLNHTESHFNACNSQKISKKRRKREIAQMRVAFLYKTNNDIVCCVCIWRCFHVIFYSSLIFFFAPQLSLFLFLSKW